MRTRKVPTGKTNKKKNINKAYSSIIIKKFRLLTRSIKKRWQKLGLNEQENYSSTVYMQI